MRERKTEFRWFGIPQWKEEEQYLQARHKEGWKFERVTLPGIYHFEKCEPEDMVYQLDYNQEGIAHKSEYVQMFQDCGWEYMQDLGGYSYFRKPRAEMNGEEEIFCDEASRIEMMKRVFRGRMLPLVAIFFCCIIPQLFMQSMNHYWANNVLFYMFVVMFIAYLAIFVQFGYQFWKLLKERD